MTLWKCISWFFFYSVEPWNILKVTSQYVVPPFINLFTFLTYLLTYLLPYLLTFSLLSLGRFNWWNFRIFRQSWSCRTECHGSHWISSKYSTYGTLLLHSAISGNNKISGSSRGISWLNQMSFSWGMIVILIHSLEFALRQ